MFIKGLKETRRIEAVTGSPLLSHLGETITGVRTIRAFRIEDEFIKKMFKIQETNMQGMLLNKYVQNWFSLRMSLFSILIMLVSFTMCIVLKASTSAVLIGMTLIYISSIQEFLYYTFTSMAEVEA